MVSPAAGRGNVACSPIHLMAFDSFNDNVYFLGVNGDRGSGELFFPKENYSTNGISGNMNAPTLPEGYYKVKERRATSEKGIKLGTEGWKYPLIAVTEDEGKETTLKAWDKDAGEMRAAKWDPVAQRWRTSLLIHPDAGKAGTLGCVGVRGTPYAPGVETDSTAGSADMNAVTRVDELLSGRGESLLQVKYFNTQAELDAFKRTQAKLRGHDSAASPAAGDASQTNQSQPLQNGQRDVRAGTQQRPVAFANGQCTHTGGAPVVQGSQSVCVGRPQNPLARQTDRHRDGAIIRDGVPTARSR